MSSNAGGLEPRGDANVTLSIDLAALLARSPRKYVGGARRAKRARIGRHLSSLPSRARLRRGPTASRLKVGGARASSERWRIHRARFEFTLAACDSASAARSE
ncbi:MAG: hypothetical protein BGO98_42570 [Myxococcales bacterium 68-20]|nr:MAG: hypothetical protein BGO98_42570 [Myxococcales bacterium 68-20]